MQDSFFEIGGHSLLATQVVSRLQEIFQIELPVRELFEYTTVESLAKRLEQLRKGDKKREIPPLIPMERGEAIPLSYANNVYGLLINLHLIVPFTICQWYAVLQGIGYLKHWKRDGIN
ncbi:phosphopantetheine-binding protein [Bacillus sp. CB102A.1]